MASTLLHFSALGFFPALMTLSASMDLLTFTIPNRICISLALGYFILATALGVSTADILLNMSCALAILALAFGMFNLGWVGGGDAKLAAATAVWMGWSSIIDYGLTAAIYGGILTLMILTARMAPLPAALGRFAWVVRLHDCKSGVPYGIALAAAGLMQYPGSGIWAAAAYPEKGPTHSLRSLRAGWLLCCWKTTHNVERVRKTVLGFVSNSLPEIEWSNLNSRKLCWLRCGISW